MRLRAKQFLLWTALCSLRKTGLRVCSVVLHHCCAVMVCSYDGPGVGIGQNVYIVGTRVIRVFGIGFVELCAGMYGACKDRWYTNAANLQGHATNWEQWCVFVRLLLTCRAYHVFRLQVPISPPKC